MNSADHKSISLGERWRREATRSVDDARLAAALEALPSIRKPMVRIRPGSIRCEMEGAMGSIHEVSLQIRTLPMRDWSTLVRVLRRSKSIVEALENGRVPRSFDRLVARIVGEPLFPEARSVTFGCSCDLPEKPCRHVLALHELFARRLDEKPWELMMLRGVDLQALLARVRQTEPDSELPPLAYGVPEEPVLFPDAEDADLGQTLSSMQVRWFTGALADRCVEAALKALHGLSATTPPPPPPANAAPAAQQVTIAKSDEDPDNDEKPARKGKARKQSTAEAIESDVEKVRKSAKPG
ncbi:MAG: hypothetical protein FJ301_02435 [Planctomycetes bacterium]|nr:hypothetical protein [Planctomycetota bacterium]